MTDTACTPGLRCCPDHPACGHHRPMTKTEARKHLADARRCLLSAAKALTPPPAWMGTNHLSVDQRRRIFRAHIRGAAASIAALAEYEVSDRG